MKFTQKLEKLASCKGALRYAEQFPSLQKAWDACERGDWMLWLIGKQCGKPGSRSRRKLVLVAAQCARTAWKWMPTEGKAAIRVAERYGKGDKSVTAEQLRLAAFAADAADATFAADAANAAAFAADAAFTVAHAANAAANAAAFAADAVFTVAHAAAFAADAAFAVAQNKVLKKCADIVRKYYPKAPLFRTERTTAFPISRKALALSAL